MNTSATTVPSWTDLATVASVRLEKLSLESNVIEAVVNSARQTCSDARQICQASAQIRQRAALLRETASAEDAGRRRRNDDSA